MFQSWGGEDGGFEHDCSLFSDLGDESSVRVQTFNSSHFRKQSCQLKTEQGHPSHSDTHRHTHTHMPRPGTAWSRGSSGLVPVSAHFPVVCTRPGGGGEWPLRTVGAEGAQVCTPSLRGEPQTWCLGLSSFQPWGPHDGALPKCPPYMGISVSPMRHLAVPHAGTITPSHSEAFGVRPGHRVPGVSNCRVNTGGTIAPTVRRWGPWALRVFCKMMCQRAGFELSVSYSFVYFTCSLTV